MKLDKNYEAWRDKLSNKYNINAASYFEDGANATRDRYLPLLEGAMKELISSECGAHYEHTCYDDLTPPICSIYKTITKIRKELGE